MNTDNYINCRTLLILNGKGVQVYSFVQQADFCNKDIFLCSSLNGMSHRPAKTGLMCLVQGLLKALSLTYLVVRFVINFSPGGSRISFT